MELIERPNLRATHYLNSITYDTFRKDCIDDANVNVMIPPTEEQIETWFACIKRFCASVIKTKGVVKRIYSHSKSTPAGLGGRLYSGGSAQGIWAPYRGLCFRSVGTDIDMANAHPVILRYICKEHAIPCPQLEYYINNRDECLTAFESRAQGKHAYLVATNSDVQTKLKNKPPHFRAYEKEIHQIQSAILKLDQYKPIIATVPDSKTDNNFAGSAINRVLCYYENIILAHAIHFLNQQNIEIAILMFDGLMIYGNHYNDANLLANLQAYIDREMPNLNMQWAYKQHDNSIIPPDTFNEHDYVVADIFRSVINDAEAIDLFTTELKPRMLADPTGRIWFKRGNIWTSNTQQIDDALLCHILSSKVMKRGEKGKCIEYTGNYRNAKPLCTGIISKIREINVVDIYNLFHTTTKGRLCFQDGVLDFTHGTFTKWDQLDYELYTTQFIRYDFAEYFANPDADTIRQVKEHVIENLFGNDTDLALRFLSRAIAGHCEDKRWATFIGQRNCGKGVLYDALSNAFGEYVRTFELGFMMYQRSTESDEVSRKNYWMLDLEFTRLAMSQEIDAKSKGMKFDGKKMKKLSGGEDYHVARRNNDRYDTVFKIDATFMMLGNNDLNVDTPDVNATRLQFSSACQFQTQDYIDTMRNMGLHELVLSTFRVADPSIKSKCASLEWKMALVYLLFQNYTHYAVDIPTEDVEESIEDKPAISILNMYDVTGKHTDLIQIDELYANFDLNKKVITTELEAMGVKKKKMTSGIYRMKYCFVGIKQKSIHAVVSDDCLCIEE